MPQLFSVNLIVAPPAINGSVVIRVVAGLDYTTNFTSSGELSLQVRMVLLIILSSQHQHILTLLISKEDIIVFMLTYLVNMYVYYTYCMRTQLEAHSQGSSTYVQAH